jgi:hypothetical protein
MIVAMIALIVALAGTAMAAPTAIKSILNKKEKKQASNIAKNQIRAQAPNLSVKHATTAGSADTAKRADVATNADALSGHTVIAAGDLDGPGLVTNSSCTPVSKAVTGARAGDHLVATPPNGWPTYEITFTARVSTDTVTYEVCNESGTNQNFGTSPPVRFLLVR